MTRAPAVRPVAAGAAADHAAVGGLLDRFNREAGAATPGAAVLAARVAELLAGGDTRVLLVDGPRGEPAGVAVLRLRAALWSAGAEAYLAELYVTPERRREGRGRALLQAAIDAARAAGADTIDLATSDGDAEALALYASAGFTDREGGPDGPRMRYLERGL